VVGIYATSDFRHEQFEKNFEWEKEHTVFSDAMEASKIEPTIIWGHPSGYKGNYPYLYLGGAQRNEDLSIKGYITFDEDDMCVILEDDKNLEPSRGWFSWLWF
jgi:hypothetical protein